MHGSGSGCGGARGGPRVTCLYLWLAIADGGGGWLVVVVVMGVETVHGGGVELLVVGFI